MTDKKIKLAEFTLYTFSLPFYHHGAYPKRLGSLFVSSQTATVEKISPKFIQYV